MAVTAHTDRNRTTPPAAPAAAPKPYRVSTGRVDHAAWVHVYGPEGVGKSSLGAAAPAPIFLDVEQGTKEIETTRYLFGDDGRTMPRDFEEFLDGVHAIERDPRSYRTLVVDTLDAVEALIWRFICDRDQKRNIPDYGYGKGENYVALDEWRRLIAALERVRDKGMNVITLSHSIVRHFDDPESDGWDRYTLKLHEKASGLIKERADAVCFANFEVVLKKKSKDSASKKLAAVTTDARWLYTRRTGAYDAKNRYALPAELPLDWTELWTAIKAREPENPAALQEAIREKAAKLGGDVEAKTLGAGGYLEASGTDAVKLAKINTWLNGKLAEAGAENES